MAISYATGMAALIVVALWGVFMWNEVRGAKPGAHDVSDRLLIPERLYGREPEIDTLLVAFDRVVADGTSELVLVSGYAGIGKSSVVNELHQALVPSRGLFASGKFDQYKRDIPYATLAQAFQSLIRSILARARRSSAGGGMPCGRRWARTVS
jgi:hypothetical protein